MKLRVVADEAQGRVAPYGSLLDELGLHKGDELEVLGFVHYNYQTWAVYLTDEGRISEVPIWALGGAPKMVFA